MLILIILDLIAVIIMTISLCLKVGLPYLFIFSVLIISLLTIIFLFKYNSTSAIYWHLMLIYILRCSVYFLSTEFSVLPFGDPYWDLGVVKTFLQNGNAEVINNMTNWPSSNLAWMSGWPLLHIFSMIFVTITGLSVMHSAVFITFLFIIMFFLFAYLLITLVSQKITGKNTLGPIAILIFVTSPESLFWNIQFKYQTIAMLLMLLIYFIIFKTFSQKAKSIELTIIMLITLFAIVIGHHLTSMAITAYLVIVVIVSKTLDYFILDLNLKNKIYTHLAIGTCVFGFLWSLQYANFIWSSVGSVLQRMIAFFDGVTSFEKAVVLASYPDILKPTWGMILLITRDILMYIPTIVGYLIIVKLLPKRNIFCYLIALSMSIFGLMIIVNMLFIHIEPIRIVTYALPYLALTSALFYHKILKQKILIGLSMFLIVFAGFIGQGSHNFIPLHLWNNSIEKSAIGEHNLQYASINSFINQNDDIYDLIYSDDFSLLYSLLDPESYKKIQSFRKIRDNDFVKNKLLVVSFRDFGVYSYSAAMAASGYNEKLNRYQDYVDFSSKIRTNVNQLMFNVCDVGSIKIFVSKEG